MTPETQRDSSYRTLLYNISRYRFGSLPLSRFLVLLLLFCILLFRVGVIPGLWWGISLSTSLILLLLTAIYRLSKQDFINFISLPTPHIAPSPLSSTVKISLFATGQFSVEGEHHRFTWLPGLFRTFSIREHAVLCQVEDNRYLGVCQWPKEQVGMWYIFIKPESLIGIQWGKIRFGQNWHPSIAVSYQLNLPKRGRFRPAKVVDETVYFAFLDEQEGRATFADLLYSLS